MPAISREVVFSGYLSGGTGPIAKGKALIYNTAKSRLIVSTAANRAATGRKTAGIALTTGDDGNTAIEVQFAGPVGPEIVNLGAGADTTVYVDANGSLARGGVAGVDDIVGRCDADGLVYLLCGGVASVGGGGGGGSPGGVNGDVQIRIDASTFGGVSPGANGNVLTSNGTAWASAAPAGGSVPTGTGFRRVTLGVEEAAAAAVDLAGGATHVTGVLPEANQADQTMAGDVTGTTSASVVAKVNGVAYPVGAATVGQVPRVTAANTVAYGPVDLADADAVTGVLPSANAPSHAGDVTGTHAATVVARVNGATYPAAGALVTGTVPRVTGASAVAYGALDLANANARTGVLPLANQAAPTGTGVAKVSAGAWTAAASAIVNADVDAAAAIAGTKVDPNFGAQNVATTGDLLVGANPASTGDIRWANATRTFGRDAGNANDFGLFDWSSANDLWIGRNSVGSGNQVVNLRLNATTEISLDAPLVPVSGAMTIGSTPASTGALRLENSAAIYARNAANSADIAAISTDGSNGVHVGATSVNGSQAVNTALRASSGIQQIIAGTTKISITSTSTTSNNPIIGSASAWGSVNAVGTQVMGDTNQTPAASVYTCDSIKTTGALTATRTLTLPTATDAQGYTKVIDNQCTGAFAITVKCAAGTTIDVANGRVAIVRVESTGVRRVTADSLPT